MNEMKTVNIKGKEYVLVNERIKAFRNNYKDYALVSEMVELTPEGCTMKASIIDPQGRVVATGFAREVVGKTPINKFAFVENCVPLDTKILTKDGWKFYYQLKEGEEVLSFNMETQKVEFCKLLRINVYENKPLLNLKTSRFNVTCTPGHKWVVRSQYHPSHFKVATEDLRQNHQILQNFPQEYKESVLGRKLGWLMCDCEIKRSQNGLVMNADISQAKYIEDIEELFGKGEKTHKYNESWKDNYQWTIPAKEVREILGYFGIDTYKDLPKSLLNANIDDVAGCYRSMMLADGTKRKNTFSSTYIELVEAMQIACVRLGFATTFITSRMLKNSTRPLYTIGIKKTLGAYASEFEVKNIPPHNVWCPTTENGTWFMKQGTFVTLTSNCETSAWGRALGNFGIGVDTAICSAEELLQKMSQEEPAKIELPLDELHKGEIASCRSKDELEKVCTRIQKELGKEAAKYRKSLVKSYKDKLAELGE